MDVDIVGYNPLAGSWPAPRNTVFCRTNSFLYMPLLLEAAGLLHEQDAATWQSHPLAVEWWADSIAILRASPEINASDFVNALLHIDSIPGVHQTLQRFNEHRYGN